MKIIKKLDANGNVVFVNAETNEVIDLSITDETPNSYEKLQNSYTETLKNFTEQQEAQNKKINELLAENQATKEANIKSEFLANGGNEHAWNVFKASHGHVFNSQDVKADIAKIKQEHGFLFNSSPDHSTQSVDQADELDKYPDTFYK